MSELGLKGLTSVLQTLDRIAGSDKKAARAGLKAGIVVLGRTIKKAIDGSPASPRLKRAAKRTIGQRVLAFRGRGEATAKAGFSVGKRSSKKQERATARSESNKPGVGISSKNVRWFVFGTDARETARGANRGAIDSVFEDVIDTAVSLAIIPMMAAAENAVSKVLAREAAKAKLKGR